MPRIYAIIAFFLSVSYFSAFSQWHEVNLPPRTQQSPPLCKIAWPDSSTGYIFDEKGYYHKSTDRGATWHYESLPLVPLPRYVLIRDAHFITPEFFIVSTRWDGDWVDSAMIYTTDGGESWSDISGALPVDRYHRLSVSPYPYSEKHPLKADYWLYSYTTVEDTGEWEKFFMDIVLLSRDSGRSWTVSSIDTLDKWGKGLGNPAEFIALDSLVMFKIVVLFYEVYEEQNYYHIKRTSDGGKTWKEIQGTGHALDYDYHYPLPNAFFRTSNGGIYVIYDGWRRLVLLANMEDDAFPGSWLEFSTKNCRNLDYNHDMLVYEDIVYDEVGKQSSKTALVRIVDGAVVGSRSITGQLMRFSEIAIRNRREIYGITYDGGSRSRCYVFYNDILSAPGEPSIIDDHVAELAPYPNPLYSGNTISVENPFQDSFGETIRYSLTDMLGRTIMTGVIDGTRAPELRIALDDAIRGKLTSGLRLLRLECGGKISTGRIVIAR